MSELDLATWRTLVALASVGLVMVGGRNLTRRFKRREWKDRNWRQYRKLFSIQ